MPKIPYITKNFGDASWYIISLANMILDDYAEQGYTLTLRQLYYQFVARGMFPDDRRWRYVEHTKKWVRDINGTRNADPNYKWLGSIVNDARMAGNLDWDHIEDRTRGQKILSHWDSPKEILEDCVKAFHHDLWADQGTRIEVWVEKDALTGIIGPVCESLDIPYLSCRGYMSQSEMWKASLRFDNHTRVDGQKVVIIHMGDHDPSGIDMTRDIQDRLNTFCQSAFPLVYRVALNMHQIQEYNPPPDPAKLSDSRGKGYIAEYGRNSWELDALEPEVLAQVTKDSILEYCDIDIYKAAVKSQEKERKVLDKIAKSVED